MAHSAGRHCLLLHNALLFSDMSRRILPLEVPTIVDSATDRLRDLILSGEYRPATRLVERQMPKAV